MVKNEAKQLPRLLESAKGLYDNIVALDTGSTDDTIATLQSAGAKVFTETFVNFAVSRSQLCRLARSFGDYMLLADADFIFNNNGFDQKQLRHPCYSLMLTSGSLTYALPRILKSDRDWKFRGVVHEYIEGTEHSVLLDSLTIEHKHDGVRSQENRYLQDLNLLIPEHLAHPNDPRTVFYLAQTLNSLGMNGCAQLYYEQRAGMKDTWEEERWFAQREAARLAGNIAKLFDAHFARPWRAEPLMDIVKINRSQSIDALRKTIPYPPKDDKLFIEKDAYNCNVATI